MFTGLVEELGVIQKVQRQQNKHILTIGAKTILGDQKIGDSIAVDGACQTITSMTPESFTVETLTGTLRKTTMGKLTSGVKVNLERALALGQRLGGHMVQGHIQDTGRVREIQQNGENVFLSVAMAQNLLPYCIPEGSIALQGVSLTIYEKDSSGITVNIIPHTWSVTSLKALRPGDPINVETDLIARHLEALLPHNAKSSSITSEALKAWGY